MKHYVIGIDPGSRFTGFGVLRVEGDDLKCLEFGAIRTREKDPFYLRLLQVGQALETLLRKYRPQFVSLEKVFYARNADSALKLGQVRGVCLYESVKVGAQVMEYVPTSVKASITGAGHADKEQVRMMVARILRLGDGVFDQEPFDATDALALALHHALHVNMRVPEVRL